MLNSPDFSQPNLPKNIIESVSLPNITLTPNLFPWIKIPVRITPALITTDQGHKITIASHIPDHLHRFSPKQMTPALRRKSDDMFINLAVAIANNQWPEIASIKRDGPKDFPFNIYYAKATGSNALRVYGLLIKKIACYQKLPLLVRFALVDKSHQTKFIQMLKNS